ncbi:DUF6894 family protein [Lichenifustis flavocetrariae]|uniref:DUF6894 domain-containing protein n=1 Tax=Lichenifustis flavocetrariae TaxID=2949735 RepID=A0AA42CQT8_9HYPH|nr:hypothetical protein [Lichenifustis flavocetrariae]MCW6511765.1 hypothetical protein [Lichenifustis flavocetrariae]
MPRYHFNTHDGQTTLDREGTVLSGLRAARRRAIRLSGALIESDFARMQLGEDWRMEVTDDHGRLLFRLDFTVLEFREPSDAIELQGAGA